MNKTERFFKEQGIVKGNKTKALALFDSLVPDFSEFADKIPSEYINDIWRSYLRLERNDNSINGKVFEYLLITLFVNYGIVPIYFQAKVAFVPNIEYDMLLYTPEGPVALSVKTSLRERYKQADLEAIALKYVHRKAKCYLLTLDEQAAASTNAKIREGEVIGIDKVIDCRGDALDELIAELQTMPLSKAGSIEIVTASTVVEV